MISSRLCMESCLRWHSWQTQHWSITCNFRKFEMLQEFPLFNLVTVMIPEDCVYQETRHNGFDRHVTMYDISKFCFSFFDSLFDVDCGVKFRRSRLLDDHDWRVIVKHGDRRGCIELDSVFKWSVIIHCTILRAEWPRCRAEWPRCRAVVKHRNVEYCITFECALCVQNKW